MPKKDRTKLVGPPSHDVNSHIKTGFITCKLVAVKCLRIFILK